MATLIRFLGLFNAGTQIPVFRVVFLFRGWAQTFIDLGVIVDKLTITQSGHSDGHLLVFLTGGVIDRDIAILVVSHDQARLIIFQSAIHASFAEEFCPDAALTERLPDLTLSLELSLVASVHCSPVIQEVWIH